MKDFEVLKTLVATNAHTNVTITIKSIMKTQLSNDCHGFCLTDEKASTDDKWPDYGIEKSKLWEQRREERSCFCFSINNITRNSAYSYSASYWPSFIIIITYSNEDVCRASSIIMTIHYAYIILPKTWFCHITVKLWAFLAECGAHPPNLVHDGWYCRIFIAQDKEIFWKQNFIVFEYWLTDSYHIL